MTELTRATQITKDRLHQWRKRNEAEGVACAPAVLVNVFKGGIVLNMVTDVPLTDILKLLQMACVQVEEHIAKSPGNALTIKPKWGNKKP